MGEADGDGGMGINKIQTMDGGGMANAISRVFGDCKELQESRVRISDSSALTHRKRGLDFGSGGSLVLLTDSF
jgi:hypothetical protein